MHFEIELLDKVCPLCFDNKCNKLDYSDSNYLICVHEYEDGSFDLLAMIPHHRVEYIEKVEEEE